MTFLNASLVLGIAAISVPILLHLIARREPRKVVFPSVRFLTKRFESNRSRLRVRRWWLLALRIAAVAAFALALARPAIDRSLSVTWLTIALVGAAGVALLVMATIALTRGQPRSLVFGLTGAAALALLVSILWGGYTYASGPGVSLDDAAPVAIAIVLDNSPTSAWNSAGDNRINRMKELAAWMVTRLPPTSRIAIVDRSSQPVNFSLDVASALSKVEQLRPLQVTVPMATRVDSAVRLVRTSELNSRQILVVTDLSRTTWDSTVGDAALTSISKQTPAVAVTVFDMGAFAKANRSLSIPNLTDATPAAGASLPISTKLELFAGDDTTSMTIAAELQMYENDPGLPVIRDGKVKLPATRSVDRTSVRVAAGGSSQLLLTVPPLEVGTHHGQVRLVGDDALMLDDVRYFTLRVLPPVPVLLVCDDTDEARVIRLAMSEEFAIEQIEFDDMPVIRLADYPAIIVIDPPRPVITDPSLSEYVQSGGAVLVCLGPSLGDGPLESDGVPKLLRRWRAPAPGTFFQVTAPSHPLLSPLTEIVGGVPWSGYRVQQYWQAETSDAENVLVRYAGSDHAAIIERMYPNEDRKPGRWLTLTTPLPALSPQTATWNELFGASDPWPAFVLVRQFAEYLTGRGAGESMSLVGQPQVIAFDASRNRSQGADPSDSDSSTETRRLQLFPPNSSAAVPLNVANENEQVVYSDVSRSGTYWWRGGGSSGGFSANLNEEATILQRLESSDLDQVFGGGTYTLAQNREDIELAENESQQRVSLYSPVMLLALLVFLLEQVLGNRFYRSTGTSASSSGRASAA